MSLSDSRAETLEPGVLAEAPDGLRAAVEADSLVRAGELPEPRGV
jgi:hypothetical protein